MGFRRAKSTQGNTNCQKNIFEDDQVPGHHPRALNLIHFFDEKKDGAAGSSIVCFGASIPCHAI